jgi:D-sedoheptulose 7-phosphate isomerase
MAEENYQQRLREAIAVYESLVSMEEAVRRAGKLCTASLAGGHKLLICGNGGSAAEAQHLAGELMGRYKEDRRPLAAVALTADSALVTCVGNDYCFEEVFSRQVQALGNAGDVLIVFTTSGNSPNVLRALEAAAELKIASIAFLGREGGKAKGIADCELVVRHPETARAQEGHQFLMHALMDEIEAWLERE